MAKTGSAAPRRTEAWIGTVLEAVGGPLDGEYLALDDAVLQRRRVEIGYGRHQYHKDRSNRLVYAGEE